MFVQVHYQIKFPAVQDIPTRLFVLTAQRAWHGPRSLRTDWLRPSILQAGARRQHDPIGMGADSNAGRVDGKAFQPQVAKYRTLERPATRVRLLEWWPDPPVPAQGARRTREHANCRCGSWPERGKDYFWRPTTSISTRRSGCRQAMTLALAAPWQASLPVTGCVSPLPATTLRSARTPWPIK